MPVTRVGSRHRAIAAWAVAAGCLLGGYADLTAGGVTLAPVLLVVGYAFAIPVALLTVRDERR